MMNTLKETHSSLLKQLKEIEKMIKDASPDNDDYHGLIQEKIDLKEQVEELESVMDKLKRASQQSSIPASTHIKPRSLSPSPSKQSSRTNTDNEYQHTTPRIHKAGLVASGREDFSDGQWSDGVASNESNYEEDDVGVSLRDQEKLGRGGVGKRHSSDYLHESTNSEVTDQEAKNPRRRSHIHESDWSEEEDERVASTENMSDMSSLESFDPAQKRRGSDNDIDAEKAGREDSEMRSEQSAQTSTDDISEGAVSGPDDDRRIFVQQLPSEPANDAQHHLFNAVAVAGGEWGRMATEAAWQGYLKTLSTGEFLQVATANQVLSMDKGRTRALVIGDLLGRVHGPGLRIPVGIPPPPFAPVSSVVSIPQTDQTSKVTVAKETSVGSDSTLSKEKKSLSKSMPIEDVDNEEIKQPQENDEQNVDSILVDLRRRLRMSVSDQEAPIPSKARGIELGERDTALIGEDRIARFELKGVSANHGGKLNNHETLLLEMDRRDAELLASVNCRVAALHRRTAECRSRIPAATAAAPAARILTVMSTSPTDAATDEYDLDMSGDEGDSEDDQEAEDRAAAAAAGLPVAAVKELRASAGRGLSAATAARLLRFVGGNVSRAVHFVTESIGHGHEDDSGINGLSAAGMSVTDCRLPEHRIPAPEAQEFEEKNLQEEKQLKTIEIEYSSTGSLGKKLSEFKARLSALDSDQIPFSLVSANRAASMSLGSAIADAGAAIPIRRTSPPPSVGPAPPSPSPFSAIGSDGRGSGWRNFDEIEPQSTSAPAFGPLAIGLGMLPPRAAHTGPVRLRTAAGVADMPPFSSSSEEEKDKISASGTGAISLLASKDGVLRIAPKSSSDLKEEGPAAARLLIQGKQVLECLGPSPQGCRTIDLEKASRHPDLRVLLTTEIASRLSIEKWRVDVVSLRQVQPPGSAEADVLLLPHSPPTPTGLESGEFSWWAVGDQPTSEVRKQKNDGPASLWETLKRQLEIEELSSRMISAESLRLKILPSTNLSKRNTSDSMERIHAFALL